MPRSPLVAVLVAVALAQVCEADDKKADKWSPSVELTAKAKKWPLEEAKPEAKIFSDRDYAFTDLPKEIVGGTLVRRDSGENVFWLPASSLKAKKDATVYAIVRTRYLRKETINKDDRAKFEKEGWKPIEGKVATTFPDGEGWQWVAYKKDVKAGTVNLQLSDFTWGRRTVVVFVVK